MSVDNRVGRSPRRARDAGLVRLHAAPIKSRRGGPRSSAASACSPAVGALFSLPFAVHEALAAPGRRLQPACARRLSVRGPRARPCLAYAGFALSRRPLRLGAHPRWCSTSARLRARCCPGCGCTRDRARCRCSAGALILSGGVVQPAEVAFLLASPGPVYFLAI